MQDVAIAIYPLLSWCMHSAAVMRGLLSTLLLAVPEAVIRPSCATLHAGGPEGWPTFCLKTLLGMRQYTHGSWHLVITVAFRGCVCTTVSPAIHPLCKRESRQLEPCRALAQHDSKHTRHPTRLSGTRKTTAM